MTDIPQLEIIEKLELENIMLRMALESERLNKYEMMRAESNKTLNIYQGKLEAWNKGFENRLKPLGLTMADIGIDAETGKVFLLNQKADQPQRVD